VDSKEYSTLWFQNLRNSKSIKALNITNHGYFTNGSVFNVNSRDKDPFLLTANDYYLTLKQQVGQNLRQLEIHDMVISKDKLPFAEKNYEFYNDLVKEQLIILGLLNPAKLNKLVMQTKITTKLNIERVGAGPRLPAEVTKEQLLKAA